MLKAFKHPEITTNINKPKSLQCAAHKPQPAPFLAVTFISVAPASQWVMVAPIEIT
jgi:hypothetical protein